MSLSQKLKDCEDIGCTFDVLYSTDAIWRFKCIEADLALTRQCLNDIISAYGRHADIKVKAKLDQHYCYTFNLRAKN